jgi:hypothetical protein
VFSVPLNIKIVFLHVGINAQLTLRLFISGILHTILGEQSRVKILLATEQSGVLADRYPLAH